MDTNSKIAFTPAKDIPYPSDWPPQEFFYDQSRITLDQLTGLRVLIGHRAGEKQIDQFIRENPTVLTAALRFASTGHHGAWVLSQQMLRPKLGTSQPGLIPDFIIGGKSSDGFEWWVAEIKGADAKLFSHRNSYLCLSDTLNKGVCQLLTYVDYCDEAQATIRDQLKLTRFRRPNGLIIIGRGDELDEDSQKQKLKSAWNKINAPHMEIRTFDALLRTTEHLYHSWQSLRSELSNQNAG
jgi:hypothetical protein